MTNPTSQTAERFLQIMNRMRKLGLGDSSSSTTQVSPAQMALLDWIAASDGCGVQDIAEGLGLTPPTVSVGVKRLEYSGFLKRKPNPQDKRAVQFFLTAKGQSAQQQAQGFRRKKMEIILSGLAPEEQEILLSLLEKALQTAESQN
jgi:DNA-binding MarR family transcriptional regulator